MSPPSPEPQPLDPTASPAALLRQGLAAHRAGRAEAAAALYRDVLAAQPDQADALYLLSQLHLAARPPRPRAAVALLRRAVAAQPGFVDAHFALGRVLFGLGEHAGAAAAFRAVLGIEPGNIGALNNLAVASQLLGDAEAAVEAYRAALALRPDSADLHGNLGCALLALNRWEEAVACQRTALALRPGDAGVLGNLAAALTPDRPEEALARYREALEAAPENADTHYGYSLALLREGRYAEGWAEMEWWRRTANGVAARRHEGLPDWDGSAGAAPVLVYPQQGYGDVLQFVRFLALAAQRRPVVLEAPRALHRLLEGLDPPVKLVLPGGDAGPVGAACPLLGLPHRLGVTLENLPAPRRYLSAPAAVAARWAGRLADLPGRKVGLCWAGNPDLGGKGSPLFTDRRRSLDAAWLEMLAGLPGVSFVSLQKAAPTPAPARLGLTDWSGELHDFAETAGLIEGLDLVISVDTAVAHLAGALGKEVWLLNRWDSDWRWLRGRDDSPWYPSLRQFRQPAPGDWATPLAAIGSALIETPEALYAHARAQGQAGRRLEAIALYRATIARAPESAEAHNNLGNQLLADGQAQEALAAYDAALALRPGYAGALANRGMALKALGRLEEAEAALRQAVETAPELAAAWNALGTTLSAQGRLEEALEPLRTAHRLAPGEPSFLVNQGVLLTRLRRPREAIDCHRAALALGESLEGRLAMAEALLLDGQLREGFRAWERRPRPGFARPQWHRDAPEGGTVLLHAEQGLGDSLQFCRYVPLVARRARVLLRVPAPLQRLLARLPGVSAMVEPDATPPEFDWHSPLPSLPFAFGTKLGSIPAGVPYLHADPVDIRRWADRLAALPGRRVGLCWAGNPALADNQGTPIDPRRSLPAGALAPLAGVRGVSFVSLQKGEAAEPGLAMADWTGELGDFAETAALVAGLDLVIAVDTAVAHLAGALGKPVWLLNRHDGEWRWLLGRDDSPWYPTLRQFRQARRGDWAGVIAAVRGRLEGKEESSFS